MSQITNPQVHSKSLELVELIRKTLSAGGLTTIVVQENGTLYVTGVPTNLRAGTNTPTTMTYAVIENANSVTVAGPDANYQRPGQLLHALVLNVEEDLTLEDYRPTLKLPPNLLFEPEPAPLG